MRVSGVSNQCVRRMDCFFLVLLLSIGVLGASVAWAASSDQADQKLVYKCSFTKDGWNANDWLTVGKPYSPQTFKWVQSADCIENQPPAGMPLTDVIKNRVDDLYTSMVLKKKVTGPSKISSVMSFEPEMAPLIVIAEDIDQSKPDDVEYRKYFEIVIYNKGLNVWKLWSENGKLTWKKVAWSAFELKPDQKYELVVTVNGKNLQISVDNHTMGFECQDLPESYYAGITACEGINRFYSFSVEPIGGK